MSNVVIHSHKAEYPGTLVRCK